MHLEVVQQNSRTKKEECRNLHRGPLESLLSTRPGIGKMKFHMDRQKEGRKSREGREHGRRERDSDTMEM